MAIEDKKSYYHLHKRTRKVKLKIFKTDTLTTEIKASNKQKITLRSRMKTCKKFSDNHCEKIVFN